jgi:phosphatidylserine/phosphatidylglycerophosphate/cardiolipin synthase-like enzyme
MKISHFAIKELAPFVTGDGFAPKRTGPQLVKLFNKYGARDVYDNLGLPDLGKTNGQRPSRTQYVEGKLLGLSGKHEVRDVITHVANELEHKQVAIPKLNEILKPEGYNLVEVEGKLVVQGGVIDRSTPVVNEAHFQDIQNRILAALDKARVSIRVVMAWFTNETLLKQLVEKSKQGIDLQVAIYDDGVNKKHGVDLSQLPHKLIKRGIRGGLMHDKFCVIDNQVVITGSYNWTDNAEFRNDENVTVERDPEQATRFSEEFRRLTS